MSSPSNSRPLLRVGILGASGYGGAGLIRRLLRHPHVQIASLGSRQYHAQDVAQCWPQFAAVLGGFYFDDLETLIDKSDVIFCATPHGKTAPLVKQGIAAGKEVIDLSADFRLAPDVYETWYALRHPHPELYSLAQYGLVELHRDELHGAQLIANPGCNATTAILALAPLAAEGLLGEEVIVNILTGISGGGRGISRGFHYAEANENAKPYKLAGEHRHTAEIEMSLGRLINKDPITSQSNRSPLQVSFNPHLVPMSRGILATCYTKPETTKPLDKDSLLSLYQAFYADDPLVHVQEDLPQTKAVYGSDLCLISPRFDSRTGHSVVCAAIDNLGKGAAGQAVQNFNIMKGFKETAGLFNKGVWP